MRAHRLGQPGLHPHRDQRRVRAGEQVGELLLGRAGRLAGVEHERRDEFGVVEARLGGQPVLQRQRRDPLLESLHHDRARLRSERLRFRRRVSLRERRLRDDPLCGVRLRFGLLGLAGQLFVDLFGRLVHERPRAEHHLHRLRPRQLPARSARPSLRRQRAHRHVARQAPLEPHQLVDVRAQQQLLQAAPHDHVHGLFAEALVVALRRPVLRAGARHERARARARTQPQRERRAPQRKRRDNRDRQPRLAGHAPHEGGEEPGGIHGHEASRWSRRRGELPGGAERRHRITPSRGAPPRRRPGTGARTGFRTRTARPQDRTGRSRLATGRRCARPHAARS